MPFHARQSSPKSFGEKPDFEPGSSEFVSDINRRNGGLTPGRDDVKIKSWQDAIRAGSVDASSIEKLQRRNPRAAHVFQQATGIGTAFRQFREGIPGQSPLPRRETVGVVAQGQPPVFFPERKGITAVPAGDLGRLQRGLLGAGPTGIDLARKITTGKAPGARSRPFDQVDAKTGEIFKVFPDPTNPNIILSRQPTGINKFDKDAQQLGNILRQSKVPQALASLEKIDREIVTFNKTNRLPGVGILKNLPLSRFFLSNKGKDVRAAVDKLNEIELRILTGAAAPEFESRRINAMNALSSANDADDYVRIYIQQIRPLWKDIVDSSVGGFDRRAVKRWKRNNPFATRIEKFRSRVVSPKTNKDTKAIKDSPVSKLSDEELLSGF